VTDRTGVHDLASRPITYAAKPFLPNERVAPGPAIISPDVKLATAHVIAFDEGPHVDDVLDREYRGDRAVTDLRTKAASTISSQSVSRFNPRGAGVNNQGAVPLTDRGPRSKTLRLLTC
jgi:hypothetical protein